MKPNIKICGITDLDILENIIDLNVDFVGLIFYEKSPRFVNKELQRKLKNFNFKKTRPVCVFVNSDEEYINEIDSIFVNPILQFHGDEEENFCKSFRRDFWKTVAIKNENDLGMIDRYKSANAILLENYNPNLYGGTGEAFDWTVIDKINIKQNLILSGGINSKNVDNALSKGTWCIDINSGVESSIGIKDLKLIEEILNKIKNYGL